MKEQTRATMLQARIDDGEAYIVGVYKDRTCGCRVTGNGTLGHALEVSYCPTHAAAPSLYEALVAFMTPAGCFCYPRPVGIASEPSHMEQCDKAREAIRLAAGEDK